MKEVQMDHGEKAAMKRRLLDAIDSTGDEAASASWYSIFWTHQFRVAYAVLFITLSVSGGVVFAAEHALPGDVLYAVKTKVTEQVERAFVAATPEVQAQYETRLVERRLKEAEKLDSKKEFKEETKKIAKEEIEKQAEKAEIAFEKVRTSRKPANTVAADIMQTSTFAAPESPEPEMMRNKRINNDEDNSSDKRVEKTESIQMKAPAPAANTLKVREADEDEDFKSERDRYSDSKNDDHELNLERVYEKHKEIIKKLDIRKNNSFPR